MRKSLANYTTPKHIPKSDLHSKRRNLPCCVIGFLDLVFKGGSSHSLEKISSVCTAARDFSSQRLVVEVTAVPEAEQDVGRGVRMSRSKYSAPSVLFSAVNDPSNIPPSIAARTA
jgi:hypothetical protein